MEAARTALPCLPSEVSFRYEGCSPSFAVFHVLCADLDGSGSVGPGRAVGTQPNSPSLCAQDAEVAVPTWADCVTVT